jgi:hypothetical protein
MQFSKLPGKLSKDSSFSMSQRVWNSQLSVRQPVESSNTLLEFAELICLIERLS